MSILNAKSLVNRGSPATKRARCLAIALLDAALRAADPRILVRRHLRLRGDTLIFSGHRVKLDRIPGLLVVGAGKATGRMAEAVEELIRPHIAGGLIIVPEGTEQVFNLNRIDVEGGGHPTPTPAGCSATKRMLRLVEQAPPQALLICLISGGGSSLLSLPTPPLTLKDLQDTNRLLIRSGAPIHDINTVRKHLSQVKGGQLALRARPRPLWSLILSDVPGDQLEMVASGPTLPDSTTFSQAIEVLHRYGVWEQLPGRVRSRLEQGAAGELPETPKPGHPAFTRVVNRLVGSNRDACQAVLTEAQRLGLRGYILTTDCQGEAQEVGERLARLALKLHDQTRRDADNRPQVLIVGSETTVTVCHPGLGGRNSELVTAAMPVIAGRDGLVIASLTTDGIDGPTEYAGALADGQSHARARSMGLSPREFLELNDTYRLLKELDDYILTGPTYTNLRDVTIIITI